MEFHKTFGVTECEVNNWERRAIVSVVRPRTRLLRVVVGGQAGVNRHHRKDSFVWNSRLDIVDM